jgi:hypothetical protein
MSSIGIEVVKIALEDAISKQKIIDEYVHSSNAEKLLVHLSEEQTKLLVSTAELFSKVT